MITIKESQDLIKEFDKIRGWEGFYPLEIFANMNEEIGEIWKNFAWKTQEEKEQIVKEKKQDIENDIGDLLFLVLRLSNQFGVDMDRALRSCLKDLKQRFPVDSQEAEKKKIETLLKKIG